MTNKLAFKRFSLISTMEVPWIIEKDGVFIYSNSLVYIEPYNQI
jgi:hypothetical protein